VKGKPGFQLVVLYNILLPIAKILMYPLQGVRRQV
jgi:hypothetical protein